MKYGLSDHEWHLLSSLAIQPLKSLGAKVWLFGSRSRGDYRRFSDIDLLYEIDRNLPDGFLYDVSTQLEEADIPYKVDLVREADLAESYRPAVISERTEL